MIDEPDELSDEQQVDALMESYLSGMEAQAYNRRFGHYGPGARHIRDDDPTPTIPGELPPLEDE